MRRKSYCFCSSIRATFARLSRAFYKKIANEPLGAGAVKYLIADQQVANVSRADNEIRSMILKVNSVRLINPSPTYMRPL